MCTVWGAGFTFARWPEALCILATLTHDVKNMNLIIWSVSDLKKIHFFGLSKAM